MSGSYHVHLTLCDLLSFCRSNTFLNIVACHETGCHAHMPIAHAHQSTDFNECGILPQASLLQAGQVSFSHLGMK